ncbi:MAG TPA: hypothetical protein VIE89_31670 [Candidatus Binatia bacterium]|jgi:hypothetical protein
MWQIKHLSRRRFLTVVSLVAGVAAVGAVQRWGIGQLASFWSRLYGTLTDPGLENTTEGSLGEGTVRALLATTKTLVGNEVETSHYEVFFRWRSENLSGYKSLYERFAAVVDRAAKESHNPDFASCDIGMRREILQKFTPGTYALVFARDGLRFEKYIFQQILELFSRTDAWILLGYKSWPGTPRGLDAYTKAPSKA